MLATQAGPHPCLLCVQDSALLAYQIGFELVDSELQSFMLQVKSRLDELVPKAPAEPAAPAEGGGDAMEAEGAGAADAPAEPAAPAAPESEEDKSECGRGRARVLWVGWCSIGVLWMAGRKRQGRRERTQFPASWRCFCPPAFKGSTLPPLPPLAAALRARYALFQTVLSGDVPIELERQFLARHNHADLQILKNIKATIEPRNRWGQMRGMEFL